MLNSNQPLGPNASVETGFRRDSVDASNESKALKAWQWIKQAKDKVGLGAFVLTLIVIVGTVIGAHQISLPANYAWFSAHTAGIVTGMLTFVVGIGAFITAVKWRQIAPEKRNRLTLAIILLAIVGVVLTSVGLSQNWANDLVAKGFKQWDGLLVGGSLILIPTLLGLLVYYKKNKQESQPARISETPVPPNGGASATPIVVGAAGAAQPPRDPPPGPVIAGPPREPAVASPAPSAPVPQSVGAPVPGNMAGPVPFSREDLAAAHASSTAPSLQRRNTTAPAYNPRLPGNNDVQHPDGPLDMADVLKAVHASLASEESAARGSEQQPQPGPQLHMPIVDSIEKLPSDTDLLAAVLASSNPKPLPAGASGSDQLNAAASATAIPVPDGS